MQDANPEKRVLRSLEHLVLLRAIEHLCRVLVCNGTVTKD
jgi:hypothetical protein